MCIWRLMIIGCTTSQQPLSSLEMLRRFFISSSSPKNSVDPSPEIQLSLSCLQIATVCAEDKGLAGLAPLKTDPQTSQSSGNQHKSTLKNWGSQRDFRFLPMTMVDGFKNPQKKHVKVSGVIFPREMSWGD